MEQRRKALNRFLVEIFQEVLQTEELSLSAGGEELSLRELHLIEAVCRAVDEGGDNRPTAIAAAQRITAGTLTAAVSALEQKGYLERRQNQRDKRSVRIYPTEKARAAEARHALFHEEMVEAVLSALTEEEAEIFARALGRLAEFFRSKDAL